MFQITNTITNKDAQVVKGDTTYAVHYVITNGLVTSVQCAISEERDGNFNQVGYIRKENGRINTDFAEGYSLVEQLTTFEEILGQIDADVTTVVPKSK